MEVPSLSEYRELGQNEGEYVLRQIEQSDDHDLYEIQFEWFQEMVEEYREEEIQKPDVFAERSAVAINYINKDSPNNTPLDAVVGRIEYTNDSKSELRLYDKDVEVEAHVDLDEFIVKISNPGEEEIIEQGGLFGMILVDPPSASIDDPILYRLTTEIVAGRKGVYDDDGWVAHGPYRHPEEMISSE